MLGASALYNNVDGEFNTAVGEAALYNNESGQYNTAVGHQALLLNKGYFATAIGAKAMKNMSYTSPFLIESHNVAVGYEALMGSTIGENTGENNTAIGFQSMKQISSGSENTAIGVLSLKNTTTGYKNTATGYSALFSNQDGEANTAIGEGALKANIGGNFNSALGVGALNTNTSGDYNTACGFNALLFNDGADNNTAIGTSAMNYNQDGTNNTAVGERALQGNNTGNGNTSIGARSFFHNASGDYNTAVGYFAGVGAPMVNYNSCNFFGYNSYTTTNRTNVVLLGSSIGNGQCTADNQVCLGNTAINQIRANVTGITAYSDSRYKTNVEENVAGLDFILKLKPVTYNIRPIELHRIWDTPDSLLQDIDHRETEKIRFIGFVAQEVEQASRESGFDFPGIERPTNSSEVYSLRYTDFIMPIVKSIQELNGQLDNLRSENENLKDALAQSLETNKLLLDEQKTELQELKSILSELHAEMPNP